MKSIVAFLFIFFVALAVAVPTPEAEPGVVSYGSPVLGNSLYYPYPYYGYSHFGYPYYGFGGNVFRSGLVPSTVYPDVGIHHYI